MAEVLMSPLPPRVVAAQRQLDAALDCLNHAARELIVSGVTVVTFDDDGIPREMDYTIARDYPTACAMLRAAQQATRSAYHALAAGPERSEG